MSFDDHMDVADTKTVGKSWAFTCNNYSAAQQQLLRDIECTRVIFGREVGEQETPHLQGVIVFRKATRFNALRKVLDGFHLGKVKVLEAAWNYCLKELDYEIRDNRAPGERTDLDDLKQMVDAGASELDMFQAHFGTMVRYSKGVMRYKALSEPSTDRPDLKVYWFWGAAGTNKSRTVRELHPEVRRVTLCGDPHSPFVGRYAGQKVVVFDDPRPRSADMNFWLDITDVYATDVRVHGGTLPWHAEVIYITSPIQPDEFFRRTGDVGQADQFLRRITEIRHFV